MDTKSRKVDYVRVGSYPYGAAVTPDGKRGFVSNEADGTVSVIDSTTNKEVRRVRVGPAPLGVAVSPDGTRLYVSYAGDGKTPGAVRVTGNVTG